MSMAKNLTPHERKRRERPGYVNEVEVKTEALRQVLHALVPLEFNARRDVLRWACDQYQIDPLKLNPYFPERS
jgi:hypothetical protein